MRPLLLLCLTACASTGGDASSACLADLPAAAFLIPGTSGASQFHATSAFYDDAIWVAWNQVPEGDGFDVLAAKLACDGTLLAGPFQASESSDNEIDPVLVVSDEGALVAWSADTGASPTNLRIRTRHLALDALPTGPARDVQASVGGAVITGNHTMPALAVREGGYLLAGAFAHPEAPGFQALTVDLDDLGVPTGEGTFAHTDTERSQTQPTLSVTEGGVTLAFQEDGTNTTFPTVGVVQGSYAQITPAGRPSADGDLLAWDTDDGAVLVRLGTEVLTLDLGAGFHHSADVLALDDGFALVWMTQAQGVYARGRVGRFAEDGTLLVEHDLGTAQIPSPYRLDLTRLDDSHVFVAWPEGSNPTFTLHGRTLDL